MTRHKTVDWNARFSLVLKLVSEGMTAVEALHLIGVRATANFYKHLSLEQKKELRVASTNHKTQPRKAGGGLCLTRDASDAFLSEEIVWE